VRLEGYPLSHLASPAVQGLGLWADYVFSTWYRSRASCDTAAPCSGDSILPHATTHSRLEAGLRWRFELGSRFALAPQVSYRVDTFRVGADSSGTGFTNFPNISNTGLVLGLAGEAPLGPRQRLLARADFMPSLAGGQLLSESFFPKGSGVGLGAALGAGWEVTEHLELRLWVLFTDYLYSFVPAPAAPYQASGAHDQYWGGRLTARYSFY
jgi:hypothetical protein